MDLFTTLLATAPLTLAVNHTMLAVNHAVSEHWDRVETSSTVRTYHGPIDASGHYMVLVVLSDGTGRLSRGYDWNR